MPDRAADVDGRQLAPSFADRIAADSHGATTEKQAEMATARADVEEKPVPWFLWPVYGVWLVLNLLAIPALVLGIFILVAWAAGEYTSGYTMTLEGVGSLVIGIVVVLGGAWLLGFGIRVVLQLIEASVRWLPNRVRSRIPHQRLAASAYPLTLGLSVLIHVAILIGILWVFGAFEHPAP